MGMCVATIKKIISKKSCMYVPMYMSLHVLCMCVLRCPNVPCELLLGVLERQRRLQSVLPIQQGLPYL